MKVCLLLVLLAVVASSIDARAVQARDEVEDLDLDSEEELAVQPKFMDWFSHVWFGSKVDADDDNNDDSDDDEDTLQEKIAEAAQKAGGKLLNDTLNSVLGDQASEALSDLKDGNHVKVAQTVATAALSKMGPQGEAISEIGEALMSGDKKKVAGAVADAALTAALGESGADLAKTGIGAAGQVVGHFGGLFGGALTKVGGDSVVGKLGQKIQGSSQKVGSQMTEYGGGTNATSPNAKKIASQLADVALNIGLGPVAAPLAKTGIGAAGKLLQTGGSLLGNHLSSLGPEGSFLDKVGDSLTSSSNVVGGTMSEYGGQQQSGLGNAGILAAGQALQKTGSMVGGALSKVAGDNEALSNLANTITNNSQKVGATLTDIGNGDIDKLLANVSNMTASAA